MRRLMIPLIVLLSIAFSTHCFSQVFIENTDTLPPLEESKVQITGVIFDQETMNPIQDAIIEVQTVYPRKSSRSDFDGSFTIKGLPLGVHKIVVEAPGYEYKEVHAIELTPGKKTAHIQIQLQKGRSDLRDPNAPTDNIVEKRKKSKKPINIRIAARDLPANEMAIASVRGFNYEELNRFAGSRQDPARIMANFNGLNTQDDYNNNMIARGVSPMGFQWRLEGIPMPNPGYLGDFNMSGGMANVFSPRVLDRSDVMLGAFSAEYGNAISGIFDARLREKMVNKIRFSGQVNSTTGVELMVEGPGLSEKNGGYYFINYRLSKLNNLSYAIANAIDKDHIDVANLPNFQDLSFKYVMPTENMGRFTFFGLSGFAGQSADAFGSIKQALHNQFVQEGQESQNNTLIGIVGAKHRLMLKETRRSHSYIQTTLGTTFLNSRQQTGIYNTVKDTTFYTQANNRKNTLYFSSLYHHKFSQFLSFRFGAQNEVMLYRLNDQENLFQNTSASRFTADANATTNLLQAYTNILWKPLINVKVNMGINTQWLHLTNSTSIEPRFAFRWEFTPLHFLSFGYGMHSQMQPLQAYYSQALNGQELAYEGNLNNLDFTRSHHFVLGYDFWIDNAWRLHVELYHEQFYNVPVDTVNGVFSMLNYAGESLENISNLANEGKGYTEGIELSIERYFEENWYLLASATVFNARYTDHLGIERDVRYNNRFNFNLLAGKRIPFGSELENFVNIDLRAAYGGPRFTSVVNPVASANSNRTIFENTYGSTLASKPYFRTDLKVGVTFNNIIERRSQTVFIDFINLSNTKSAQGQYFDRLTQQVQQFTQMPFFIDFGYQFNF